MRFSFEHGGLSENDYGRAAGILRPYAARLKETLESGSYGEPESSIRLPGDKAVYSAAESVLRGKVRHPLRFVAVLGIGGSNLGAKAVYDALLGLRDSLDGAGRPKLLFFDTLDENFAEAAAGRILKHSDKAEDFLLIMVSKSGVTAETVAEAEFLVGELGKKFPEAEKRIIAVTDENSPLWESAKARGIPVLAVPEKVGGRFSVFSAVGLLPLMAAGINVTELLKGAEDMRERCLADNLKENPAAMGAAFLWHSRLKGKTIHDIFLFSPELESLGKWYRELLGESIGKTEEAGITPTVSIGSTDLHSVGQLVLDGPKDKTALFVFAQDKEGASVPDGKKRLFPKIAEALSGKKFGGIMSAFMKGAERAYGKKRIPFFEVRLSSLNERELGAFMQYKMIETMFLGRLFGVDAFNQPAVESFKKEAKKILEKTEKSR